MTSESRVVNFGWGWQIVWEGTLLARTYDSKLAALQCLARLERRAA